MSYIAGNTVLFYFKISQAKSYFIITVGLLVVNIKHQFLHSNWLVFLCSSELRKNYSVVLLLTGNLRLRVCPEGAAEAKTETLQQTNPCSCLPHSGIWKLFRNNLTKTGGGIEVFQSLTHINESVQSSFSSSCMTFSMTYPDLDLSSSHPPSDSVEVLCSGELWFCYLQDVFTKKSPCPSLHSIQPQVQKIGLWIFNIYML